MREYELMFIVAQRDVKEGKHEKLVERVRELVEKAGGRVLRVRPWGLRQLAYEIGGYDYGYYVIMQLLMEPDNTKPFEAKLKSETDVLRFLLLATGERDEGEVKVFAEMADEASIEQIAKAGGAEEYPMDHPEAPAEEPEKPAAE
jgi:ribosomal protein S6